MTETLEVQEALVVRPGDKLLVRLRPDAHRGHIEKLADALRERFPETEITVITAEQLAVVRDD